MQRQTDESIQGAGSDRVLSFRAVRVHNDHLQSGVRHISRCGVCQEGLVGALAAPPEVKQPDKPNEVAESDRADKEGNTSPSYGDWADYWNGDNVSEVDKGRRVPEENR